MEWKQHVTKKTSFFVMSVWIKKVYNV